MYLENDFQVTRIVEVRCGANNQVVVSQWACATIIFGGTLQTSLRDTKFQQIIPGSPVSNEIIRVQLEIMKRNFQNELYFSGHESMTSIIFI